MRSCVSDMSDSAAGGNMRASCFDKLQREVALKRTFTAHAGKTSHPFLFPSLGWPLIPLPSLASPAKSLPLQRWRSSSAFWYSFQVGFSPMLSLCSTLPSPKVVIQRLGWPYGRWGFPTPFLAGCHFPLSIAQGGFYFAVSTSFLCLNLAPVSTAGERTRSELVPNDLRFAAP